MYAGIDTSINVSVKSYVSDFVRHILENVSPAWLPADRIGIVPGIYPGMCYIVTVQIIYTTNR